MKLNMSSKFDEVEAMDKADKVIGEVVFALNVATACIALIRLGYEAGLRRGWQSDTAECGHEQQPERRVRADPRYGRLYTGQDGMADRRRA